jgi:HK97 family phage major capsid protein
MGTTTEIPDHLRGRTLDELRGVKRGLDAQLRELHQSGAMSDTERATFNETLADRDTVHDLIEQHEAARRAFERGNVETAYNNPYASTADPGDILTRSQSVEGWARSKGRLSGEHRGLSFDRWLRGMISGSWRGADRELAAETELRALSEGTLTAGGHLVPTPLAANVIDLARNQMQVMRAGAVTVPMTAATLKVPRLTGEGTPAWHAENAAITAADLTFDAVTFTARSLTRLVVLSTELFDDSDPSAEGVIANSFAAQIALELDRAALRGSGTAPEPRGVLNQTSVTLTAHGTNGSVIGSPPAAGTMGWEFLVDAAATVRNNNFEPTAQIMNPRTMQSLAKLRDTTNQYIAPPTYLDGLPRLQTKQIPINLTVGTSTDCSEVYTGQWDQLMVGMRLPFKLTFLKERFIDNGQYGFLAYLRADIQLSQPTAFNIDTGVRS